MAREAEWTSKARDRPAVGWANLVQKVWKELEYIPENGALAMKSLGGHTREISCAFVYTEYKRLGKQIRGKKSLELYGMIHEGSPRTILMDQWMKGQSS